MYGGGVCSLCKSPGTNKSTCPLNPNIKASQHNWNKHPNAKSMMLVPDVPEASVLLYCHGRTFEITPKMEYELDLAANLLKMRLPRYDKMDSINILETVNPTILSTDGNLPAQYHGKFNIVYDVNCDNTGWATSDAAFKKYTISLYQNMINALASDKWAIVLGFQNPDDLVGAALKGRAVAWKDKVLSFFSKNLGGPGVIPGIVPDDPSAPGFMFYELENVYIIYGQGRPGRPGHNPNPPQILFWACQAETLLCPALRKALPFLNIKCFDYKMRRLTIKDDEEYIKAHLGPTVDKYLIISYPEDNEINWDADPPVYKDDNSIVVFPVLGGTSYVLNRHITGILGKPCSIIYRSAGIHHIKDTIKAFTQSETQLSKMIIIIGHNDQTLKISGKVNDQGAVSTYEDNIETIQEILAQTQ